MNVTVSELIVKYMQRLGIDTIFGMPGAHILPVYDRLYDSDIQSVLVKHEQGAAFMAGGYARASGRIGACITTAGPGATNLVTGIANAYADKLPVLVITGETSTHIFGKGGLQESSGEGGSVDQLALFKGITRYNRIIERTDYLAQVLNRASKILLSPNPGPVLLSFPFNVQSELVDDAILDDIVTAKRERRLNGASHSTAAIAEALLAAKRPIIVAGHGAIRSRSQQLVTQLSEQLAIPVETAKKVDLPIKGTFNYALNYEYADRTPSLAWVRRHLISINSYRDDCHTSSWQEHNLPGYVWETLSFIWQGEHYEEKVTQNKTG